MRQNLLVQTRSATIGHTRHARAASVGQAGSSAAGTTDDPSRHTPSTPEMVIVGLLIVATAIGVFGRPGDL